MKGKKHRTGQRWQTAIIGELWTQWFTLWEARNSDLHGATESLQARAEREEVERSLRDIYDMRDRVEPSVQKLLCQDITNHFAKPLWFNKNWLAIHGPLVRQSVRNAKKKAIQGVRSTPGYTAVLHTTGGTANNRDSGTLDCTCLQYRPAVRVEC